LEEALLFRAEQHKPDLILKSANGMEEQKAREEIKTDGSILGRHLPSGTKKQVK
jgi:hypothetical protein